MAYIPKGHILFVMNLGFEALPVDIVSDALDVTRVERTAVTMHMNNLSDLSDLMVERRF